MRVRGDRANDPLYVAAVPPGAFRCQPGSLLLGWPVRPSHNVMVVLEVCEGKRVLVRIVLCHYCRSSHCPLTCCCMVKFIAGSPAPLVAVYIYVKRDKGEG